VILASVPAKVFWPYFAGVAILAIGLVMYRGEVLRAQGIDKMVALGPVFFAIPMAVFASQHFTEARGVSTLVPAWLPGHLFWTYFVGTAIIAAAVGIVARQQARLAALLLGVMLLVFELTLHIPRIMAHPKSVLAWATAFRDLAFSGGALAFAGTGTEPTNSGGRPGVVTLARIFLSAAAIFFGVEHFLHPEFLPGVDFDRAAPTWLPARVFWSYFAATTFLTAGVCLLLNKKVRLAATWLGIAVLALILFFYLPIVVSAPLDIGDGLNYFVSVLAFCGAALLLARATLRGEQSNA
jgi:uncharacterized membrane protein